MSFVVVTLRLSESTFDGEAYTHRQHQPFQISLPTVPRQGDRIVLGEKTYEVSGPAIFDIERRDQRTWPGTRATVTVVATIEPKASAER